MLLRNTQQSITSTKRCPRSSQEVARSRTTNSGKSFQMIESMSLMQKERSSECRALFVFAWTESLEDVLQNNEQRAGKKNGCRQRQHPCHQQIAYGGPLQA